MKTYTVSLLFFFLPPCLSMSLLCTELRQKCLSHLQTVQTGGEIKTPIHTGYKLCLSARQVLLQVKAVHKNFNIFSPVFVRTCLLEHTK